jgi:hypothetical protein
LMSHYYCLLGQSRSNQMEKLYCAYMMDDNDRSHMQP